MPPHTADLSRSELEGELQQAESVIDESEMDDDDTIPETYAISSYGADYDVEGLVKRLKRGDILIPDFQREYVWKLQEASRFIESLLLGLPVPGIFLAREADSNKLLVIDGQQRLKTLQFFYDGFFNPKESAKSRTIFKLFKVQPKFENLTYGDLEQSDRIKLDDSIIHATIVKQESPDDNNTSIYHIFERLNNGGVRLSPQEIRSAIFHGNLIDLTKDLNDYPNWRKIFGDPKNNRLKDQELILRFLAFYFNGNKYEAPMKGFITKFAKAHKNADSQFISSCRQVFVKTIDLILKSIGPKAFRPTRALNAAVFDSVMIGLAHRLVHGEIHDLPRLQLAYEELLKDKDYLDSISRSTADEERVKERMNIAAAYFKNII